MLKKINKKNILLIAIPIIILIIVIIVILLLINKDNKSINNPEGNKFKEEYELFNKQKDKDGKEYIEVDISSDNIIKYSTETEIINIINNNGDAVVYFGYPTCNYCRSSIEVLLDTTKNSKLDTIYYIDIEKNDISEELLNLLGKELNNKESYSSLVIFINDGEIVSYNKDTLSSHKDPYKKLNDSQKEGLSEIYRYGINDVIASKAIKDN